MLLNEAGHLLTGKTAVEIKQVFLLYGIYPVFNYCGLSLHLLQAFNLRNAGCNDLRNAAFN